jgi:hypothetical protein
MDELDPVLRRAADALRQPVPPDPAARERILAAVRAERRAGPAARAWDWLRRPRAVMVSPLAGLGAAAVVAGLVALASTSGEPDRGGGTARPAALASPAAGYRTVQFVLVAGDARTVTVVGDFNDWNPRATPLSATGRDGVWSAMVALRPGPHTYSFVVDGRTWVGDPAATPAPGDDFGRPSSVILVREART